MFTIFLKLIKPYHWIKNFLIFMPLVFSNFLLDYNKLFEVSKIFLFFCLLSSVIYIFNDICDYKEDQKSDLKKKLKPIANNEITLKSAKLFLIGLLIPVIVFLFFNQKFIFISGIFLILNIFYSVFLKRIFLVEIFILSLSYIIRIYAGAIAIAVPISLWMFFTVFFTSLFVISLKRKKEIEIFGISSRKVLKKYSEKILDYSIYISAVSANFFYSLYIIFKFGNLLLYTIPIVFLIFIRYFNTSKNIKDDPSPIQVFFKDPFIGVLILFWISLFIFILYRI